MVPRRRLPAHLLAELVPTRPSPVPPEVYEEGPTAQAMARERSLRHPDGFVVVQANDSRDNRHAAAEGAALSLCGLPVMNVFPNASLLVVECRGCEESLPLPGTYA
jgi:hypothetical protein